MSIKQAIENNPVIFYLATFFTGLALGIGLYEGFLRLSGRIPVASVEVEKISKYDSTATDLYNIRRILNEKELELTMLKKSGQPDMGEILALKKSISEKDAFLKKEEDRVKNLSAQLFAIKMDTKAKSSPFPVIVLFKGTSTRQDGSCTKTNPVLVVERFQLKTEGDPDLFIMTNGKDFSTMEVKKANESSGVFRADQSIPGWTVNYCAAPGTKNVYKRRFINSVTGEASQLVTVEVDT